MKRTIYIIALLTLSSAFCRAESVPSITHNFNTMSENSTLTWPVNYKTGVTPQLTYACTGTSATFGTYSDVNITLNMSAANDIITISPAIEGLTKFEINFYQNSKRESIEVYVSTDGTNWGDPITGSDYREDAKQLIRIKNLPRNNYYIQIRNKTSTAVSIFEMRYYQTSCHCLRVVSE